MMKLLLILILITIEKTRLLEERHYKNGRRMLKGERKFQERIQIIKFFTSYYLIQGKKVINKFKLNVIE